MRVGVYFNKRYLSHNEAYIKKIVSALEKSDIECVIVEGMSQIRSLDVLMVLGGDGTILMVAAECAEYGVKIIGVNYGHRGFLADFEPEKLDEAIRLVCSGEYRTEKRAMLEVGCGGKTYFALNDLVIQRSTSGNAYSNTVNLHAEIDDSTVDDFSSDGLIVSTPTGSTAYSLAAGGSILTPDLHAFILAPICAHSLHSRPIVYNDESTLKISRAEGRSALNVVIDGKAVDTLFGRDTVTVKKAKRYAEFIAADNVSFFDKLLVKLNKWSK